MEYVHPPKEGKGHAICRSMIAKLKLLRIQRCLGEIADNKWPTASMYRLRYVLVVFQWFLYHSQDFNWG